MQQWRNNNSGLDEDYYQHMLTNSGIRLTENIEWCDERKREELNKIWVKHGYV